MSICDFCSDPEVRWAYPTRDFNRKVEGLPLSLHSRGGWAACDPCHTLIEATDREGLYRRSVDNFPRSASLPRSIIAQSIRSAQDSFWAERDGEPVPATPDQKDPTR